MISFFICLFLLIGGFFVYGKFAEKVFGPDDRRTPAIAMEDGADYVPMGTARIFLIQLLNIAGWDPSSGHWQARPGDHLYSYGLPWEPFWAAAFTTT